MTYDLLGIEKNAYEEHFGGMNEIAVRDFITKKKMNSMIRTLYSKIKYVKYMCGNMDEAAKHYDMQQELSNSGQDKTGESWLLCVSYLDDFYSSSPLLISIRIRVPQIRSIGTLLRLHIH